MTTPPPGTPSRIGNFDVVRQIGFGGMGAVYLARDPELNRPVAIKVIREEVHDADALDRFFREARAAAALRHPNLITIYTCGQHEHKPYMVMEFVEGESLAEIIRARRELTMLQKLSYIEQLCAGLHVAHRAGIVHRDVKPANVMVDKDGMVRILDFGIARIEGSPLTQDGALVGSLNYMSPEQMLAKPVDHRSDIFALGSVAYELLSYERAFKGGLNDGLLQRLPYENPPALSDLCQGLPAGLEGIIVRALQKAPEDRFQDLADMRQAIVEIQRRFDGEEERTLLIPRDSLPGDDPQPDEGDEEFPPLPPAFVPDGLPAMEVGAVADVVTLPTPTPAPSSPAWSVKSKPAGIATTRTSPTTRTATIRRTVVPPPPPRRKPVAWRLLGAAALAILVVGTVIAVRRPAPLAANPLQRELPAIRTAMESYRLAYRNQDLDGVLAAFPAMPPALRQSIERTFDDCLIYEMVFDRSDVALAQGSATRARADVTSTHTCTPQSGAPERTSTRRETYDLEKTSTGWRITGAAPEASQPRAQ